MQKYLYIIIRLLFYFYHVPILYEVYVRCKRDRKESLHFHLRKIYFSHIGVFLIGVFHIRVYANLFGCGLAIFLVRA